LVSSELSIEDYFNDYAEKEVILKNIVEKKKFFYLPAKIRINLVDLTDVIDKFIRIKKIVGRTFQDKNLTQNEIDELLKEFDVAKKIISIIKEEEEQYNKAIVFITNFFTLFSGIVQNVQYIDNIDRNFLTDSYNSDKKVVYVINERNYLQIVEYLQRNFIYDDLRDNNEQSEIDNSISTSILTIAYLQEKFVFNVIYYEKTFLLDKLIFQFETSLVLIKQLKRLQKSSYFYDLLPNLINDLTKLKIKINNSRKDEISVDGILGKRIELLRIDELLFGF
jgi:hypothetical protein